MLLAHAGLSPAHQANEYMGEYYALNGWQLSHCHGICRSDPCASTRGVIPCSNYQLKQCTGLHGSLLSSCPHPGSAVVFARGWHVSSVTIGCMHMQDCVHCAVQQRLSEQMLLDVWTGEAGMHIKTSLPICTVSLLICLCACRCFACLSARQLFAGKLQNTNSLAS